jgi:hypothetical protein
MSERSKDKNFLALGVIIIFIFFLTAYLIYTKFDPDEMRRAGIFPWDSGEYRKIAEQISNNGLLQLKGQYPFATRLLFPFFYSTIKSNSLLTNIESAYFINIASSLLVILFTFLFLQKNAVPQKIAFAITGTYILFWLGPMRYSIVYPGGAFAFESLLVCILFLILERSSTKNVFSMIVGIPVVFFLAVGREFVFYLLAISLVSALSIRIILRYRIVSSNKDFIKIPPLNRLVLLFLTSLGGYLAAKFLVEDTSGGQYSILVTIATFGWFHMNIMESLYPFFYALGPLFLCFLLAASFSLTRLKLIDHFLKRSKHQFFILVFSGSGVIFAMIGGTDSDRFLLWFFPFFALFGAYALSAVWSSMSCYKITFAILMIVVTACWSRFYVPAIPHVFFPGELYNSAAGVRSDLSPQFFYGPKFLENFRLPLKTVPSSDNQLYGLIDNSQEISNYQPKISALIERKNTQVIKRLNPYKGSYAYEINNIPFPLGFAHNQYEFLVAHPYHGEIKVRAMLLLQWLLLFLAFCILLKKGQRT